MNNIQYHIGEYYRYPGTRKRFKLTETSGMIFRFECGHWCTDNVFIDLIRVKTNIQVSEDIQEELFQ
jgi:hypothetical protein